MTCDILVFQEGSNEKYTEGPKYDKFFRRFPSLPDYCLIGRW